jgi:5-(carboxyamino)imidazole ribonucleotide synthase
MRHTRIGVIGGGQLAWMMGEEADKLGVELIVQTPNPEDPAVSKATEVILAPIEDAKATTKLATHCDVITFENEFINLEALQSLAKQGICFRPSLDSLAPLLDKYNQLSYLQKIGLPVPQFILLSQEKKLESPFGFPVVLKACRHGYDGQGTFILKNQEELIKIWEKLQPPAILLEEFVPFKQELAVMAARGVNGEIIIYPVVETYQKNQVCRWVIAPANIPDNVREEINAIASILLTKLEVVGIFGIELFLSEEDKVLVNEIAPRTHNSGHYTLDACDTSQFAMQLQTVADLPLGSPALKAAGAVMVNLLGYEHSQSDYAKKRARLAAIPDAYVHWYGKSESRPGRKLGHITVLLSPNKLEQAQSLVEEIETIWYGE